MSEYNVLVVPAYMVEHVSPGVENREEDLQAVLIDFGQAVDRNHPDAIALLERDIARVSDFFVAQGIVVMEPVIALAFVTGIEEETELHGMEREWRTPCGDDEAN